MRERQRGGWGERERGRERGGGREREREGGDMCTRDSKARHNDSLHTAVGVLTHSATEP